MASTDRQTRTRGPNKGRAWSRAVDTDGDVSVIRLALDTSDPMMRRRVETLFQACFDVRRAVQSDARHRVDAYWAAHRERDTAGPKAVRERLGLSRTGLEKAAYGHLDAAPHLRRGCTKALSMHLADNVWTAVERHLFGDSSGRRAGRPRVGRWFDFTRVPGRARSHTTDRKWETFRLHGTLDGHRRAYIHNGRFHQPTIMRTVSKDTRSWWDHQGPLALVLTGLGVGEVVLPVLLPTAPCNQPHLDHHLSDPGLWHKIDLVRSPDPQAPGGWRYEAHLLVLVAPYVSPNVTVARKQTPQGRCAGADLNVSNLTIASTDADGGDVKITRVARDNDDRQAEIARGKKQRDRQRALDRSRRNQNPDQYRLSDAQQAEQQRREAAGLPAKTYTPAGPRRSRADGKPTSAYRKDRLSHGYRQTRRKMAAVEKSRRQRSRQAAKEAAQQIVAEHGALIAMEDVNVSAWARRWGRGINVFTPGRLQQALADEAEACGGEVRRASTFTTALSQHCLCGHRSKKPLSQRTHDCPACGLTANRDAMAALLAAHVTFTDPEDPTTAHVDSSSVRKTLHDPQVWDLLDMTFNETLGRQDAPSVSTHTGPHDCKQVVGSDGPPASVGSARRTAGQASDATPQQTPLRAVTSVDSPERNPCMHRYCGDATHYRNNGTSLRGP